MPSLNDMTDEELTAHFAYVRSGQAEKDMEAHYSKMEEITKAVTPEIAAERELQEIVWDYHGTLRFRENTMVTTLLEQGPEAVTKGYGSWDGARRFIHWPKGWELDQFKRLLREGNELIFWLLRNGPADMNKLGEQGVLEMDGKGFSQKDKEQFAMLIGYSVSGAGDLSYFSDAMLGRADEIADRMREENA